MPSGNGQSLPRQKNEKVIMQREGGGNIFAKLGSLLPTVPLLVSLVSS